MSLEKMIIIIGEESPSKIALLEQLQTDYNMYIPRRFTTNSEYDVYPSLYQVVDQNEVAEYINKGNIKSIGYTKNGLAFNISKEIGQGIADLYNGEVPGIILNADTTELGYYVKMYPSASILGYADDYEDLDQFKEILPDIITKEDVDTAKAISKVMSYITTQDNHKTMTI